METNLKPDHNIIQPDHEPQLVAWPTHHDMPSMYGYVTTITTGGASTPSCAGSLNIGNTDSHSPSSAGTVSVEAVMREIHRFAAERKWHPSHVTELVTSIGNLRALAGEGGL